MISQNPKKCSYFNMIVHSLRDWTSKLISTSPWCHISFHGLDAVFQLKAISFTWRHDPQRQPKLGLSAQDILKVVPEVVKIHDVRINEETNEREEYEMERMGVYYSDLIPVLIQATQDQQTLIEKQQSLIEQLEKRVQELENR